MTPKFKDWVDEVSKNEKQDHWEFVDPLSQMTAKFWLSRIFAEIEKEAAPMAKGLSMHAYERALCEAFTRIKSKFGLGG